LVVFLDHEVAWFEAGRGFSSHAEARADRLRWHAVEREANALCGGSRSYSIAVATPGMLAYYASRGPVHMQNWAHAVTHCYPLWQK
jgi:hypothetical protein